MFNFAPINNDESLDLIKLRKLYVTSILSMTQFISDPPNENYYYNKHKHKFKPILIDILRPYHKQVMQELLYKPNFGIEYFKAKKNYNTNKEFYTNSQSV